MVSKRKKIINILKKEYKPKLKKITVRKTMSGSQKLYQVRHRNSTVKEFINKNDALEYAKQFRKERKAFFKKAGYKL